MEWVYVFFFSGFKNYEAVWKSDVVGYCKILPCGIYDKFVYDHEHINLTN